MKNKNPNQNQPKPGRWGNYFKEFLMLFLAVFCGFLAENYRERRQEQEVALEYLQNMLLDLERDSVQLRQMLLLTKNTLKNTDSLKNQIATHQIEKDSGPSLRFLFGTFGFDDFSQNDGTLSQLKHSGSLRFIENQEIVDAIMQYQKAVTPLKVHEALLNNELIGMVRLRQDFDLLAIQKAKPNEKIPLLIQSRASVNRFFERVETWGWYMIQLEKVQLNVVEKGINLKKMILKIYPELRDK